MLSKLFCSILQLIQSVQTVSYTHLEPQMTTFSKQAQKTPLMIGSVFGEMSFSQINFNKQTMSEEEMKTILQKQYHEHTEKIISAFQKAYPDKKIIDVLSIDTIFRPLSKDYLQVKAKYQQEMCIRDSLGIALYLQDGKSFEELLADADEALYQAKQTKQCYCFYHTINVNQE